MESVSWQRPLYGFKITQNQAEMPLKSGFSDGLGGAISRSKPILYTKNSDNQGIFAIFAPKIML